MFVLVGILSWGALLGYFLDPGIKQQIDSYALLGGLISANWFILLMAVGGCLASVALLIAIIRRD